MSKLDQFLQGEGGEPKDTGIEVPISGRCQICQKDVDIAQYFPLHRLLKWACEDKHVSYIEEFIL